MILVMNDRIDGGHLDDCHIDGTVLRISCDDCVMRATSACGDCVVTFVLDEGRERAPAGVLAGVLADLDTDQVRVVQLFGRAGMVPRLRHIAS
jgi:hypothetical protein